MRSLTPPVQTAPFVTMTSCPMWQYRILQTPSDGGASLHPQGTQSIEVRTVTVPRTMLLVWRLNSGDSELKMAVACDPNTPVKVLDKLAKETSVKIRLEISENPSTSKDSLYLLSHDEAESVRKAALARLLKVSGVPSVSGAIQNPNFSPQLVASLAEDLEWRDVLTLFENDLDADVLSELAKARNPGVRAKVAASESAGPATLALLASDSVHYVRADVASNDCTPQNTLMLLLRDPSDDVWMKVLSRDSVPKQVLMAAAADRDSSVRQQVAAANATTADVLSQLAEDESPEVRRAVACNRNTSNQILSALASDPDDDVRLAIAMGMDEVFYSGKEVLAFRYIRRTPVDVLLKLAADVAPQVRTAVVSHPELPTETLGELAVDVASEVRWAVVRQPNLPIAAFSALVDDPEVGIRAIVAEHPQIPGRLLAGLLDDKLVFDQEEPDRDRPWSERTLMPNVVLWNHKWDNSMADWRALALVSNPQARLALATNYRAPAEVAAILADDDVEYVRDAALQSYNLPAAALRKLIDDPSPSIAGKALSLLEKHTSRFRDNLGVFIDANSVRARATLASDEMATAEWLESLALDPSVEVRVAVAGNPNTPPASFVSLSKDSDLDVAQAVSEALHRGDVPPAALDAVAMSPHTKIRVAVAAMSGLSQETLRVLVQDSEESVRLSAARNGYTAVAALVAVIATDDLNKKYGIGRASVAALCAVAQDETLTVESLHALAQSPFAEVRLSVVQNVAVSKAILANLTRDESPQVREAVGANCETPKEGLQALAHDASAAVRRAVAANPATSPVALTLLDHDPDGEVALAVALHPNIPPSSLDALVEVHDQPKANEGTSLALTMLVQGKLDRLPWVHELPGRLTRSDNMWHQGVRQAVASNPLASPDTLATLSQQPDTVAFVAGNLSTPATTLSRLVQHEDKLVREALASNPNLSEAELAILSLDQHEVVRKCVADNPHTAIQTLEILANDFSSEIKDVARSALSARTPVADH